MVESFLWGFVGASSLIIGGVIAGLVRISPRNVGLIMAFGSGVLVSAVAFDLMEEAVNTAPTAGLVIAAGLFGGCLTFYVGDLLIDRMGGAQRKDVTGGQAEGSPLAIVLGTVLDGIPESMVIGLAILQGGSIGIAYLTAVFVSNLPEAIASTSGLRSGGWSRGPHPRALAARRGHLRRCRAPGFRALRYRPTGGDRVRPRVRGWRDPHDARRHDGARGV